MSMSYAVETVALTGGAEQIVYRAGDGPPLVWFHGLDGIEPELPILSGLAERFTVHAPLSPGFESVDELREILDLHDLALYYDDLLAALGLESAILAGQSFGAMVAAELAAHFPARASRVVLISPVGLWDDAVPVPDLFAVPLVEIDGFLYGDPGKAPVPADPHDVEAFVRYAQAMTTVAKFLWPIPHRRIERRLHRLTAPVLIVHGELDRWIPASYLEAWTSALPNVVDTRVVAGAGHMVHREEPEQVLAAVDAFTSVGAAA
jgi:pimeloyl-ACP methyl ester carboxylesterase